MTPDNFVHLHVHTDHSTLDGINRIGTLPTHLKENLGQVACAITDHGNISGAYQFFKSCRKAGVKPILGMEAYYASTDRTIRAEDSDGESYYHLILLALNDVGLKHLVKLSSIAYSEGEYYKPRIDDQILGDLSQGLAATTACMGSRFSFLLKKNRRPEAEKLIDHYSQMFKHRFFLELQLHKEPEQQLINAALIEIGREKNLPLVLTNDAHYTLASEKLLHEQTLCMQTNSTMSNPKRFSFGDIDVHLASHDWMLQQAKAQGIPYEAISNTRALADAVDDHLYFKDIKNRYPHFKGLPEGVPAWKALTSLARTKLIEKFDGKVPPEAYKERLDNELRMIKRVGFDNYMLIVWELVENARKLDVMVGPGRGSVGGSLVAYALDIVALDPIKYDLPFSRFLNPGRAGEPILFSEETRKLAEALCLETESAEQSTVSEPASRSSRLKASPPHSHSGGCT